MKQNGDKLYKRKYKEKDIKQYEREISNVESDYYDILKAERVEKEMEMAEIEMKKAQNMIDHEEEIFNRPKREWVQTK